MVAKGRNMLESEIDFQYQVFKLMLEQYPMLVQQCAQHYTQQINKDAEAISEGDCEIQASMQANHPLNEVADLTKQSILFFEHIMLALIESYAESHLRSIAQKISSSKKSKLQQYYLTIKQSYPKLPELENMWPNLRSFSDARNKFIHELDMQSCSKVIDPKQHLEYAYDVLSNIVKQINKEQYEKNEKIFNDD